MKLRNFVTNIGDVIDNFIGYLIDICKVHALSNTHAKFDGPKSPLAGVMIAQS